MKTKTFRQKICSSFTGVYENGEVEAEFDLVDFAFRGLKTEIVRTKIKKIRLTKNKIIIVLGEQIN